MLLSLLNSLILFLPIVLSIAFITLIERKWLAATQRRVGPNTVGFLGLLQPFADALKLLTKENIFPGHANKFIFFLAPIFTLIFSLLGWTVIPFASGIQLIDFNQTLILSLAFSSLGIYGVLLAGWSANSKYAIIGSLRSTAQMISYELILGSSILTVVLFTNSWNFNDLNEYQTLWYIVPLLPVFIFYFISLTAELQRPPFDLPEAESELVSGYFTEHSSVPFVFFFLAEYGSLVLISTITVFLFFGGTFNLILPFVSGFWLGFKTSLITLLSVWIRATFPRLRYDTLIEICWTDILPLTIALVLLVPSLTIAFN